VPARADVVRGGQYRCAASTSRTGRVVWPHARTPLADSDRAVTTVSERCAVIDSRQNVRVQVDHSVGCRGRSRHPSTVLGAVHPYRSKRGRDAGLDCPAGIAVAQRRNPCDRRVLAEVESLG
jgi:hypothetical protein